MMTSPIVFHCYLKVSALVCMVFSFFFTIYLFTQHFPEVVPNWFGVEAERADFDVDEFKGSKALTLLVGSFGYNQSAFYTSMFPYWPAIELTLVGFWFSTGAASLACLLVLVGSGRDIQRQDKAFLIPFLLCNVVIAAGVLTLLVILFMDLGYLARNQTDTSLALSNAGSYSQAVVLLILVGLHVLGSIWSCLILLLSGPGKSVPGVVPPEACNV